MESRELNLTFPVMFNPVTWDAHAFPVYFGGSVINADSTIETVPSVQLAYFVAADSKRQDAMWVVFVVFFFQKERRLKHSVTVSDSSGALWEEAFLNAIGKAEEDGIFEHISTARFASRTLELELEANTRTVVPYFSSTFAIMGIFSVVTCMMADWVRSKPWLGLLGNVSAAMATVSAFGLCMYLGIEFIGINLAAPFLMIGKDHCSDIACEVNITDWKAIPRIPDVIQTWLVQRWISMVGSKLRDQGCAVIGSQRSIMQWPFGYTDSTNRA